MPLDDLDQALAHRQIAVATLTLIRQIQTRALAAVHLRPRPPALHLDHRQSARSGDQARSSLSRLWREKDARHQTRHRR